MKELLKHHVLEKLRELFRRNCDEMIIEVLRMYGRKLEKYVRKRYKNLKIFFLIFCEYFGKVLKDILQKYRIILKKLWSNV